MLAVVNERRVIKAAVTASGAKALKDFANTWGMKEYVVAGKIFDWFGEQDDVFQRSIVGMLKGLETSAAEEFMRRLGKKKGGKPAQVQIGEGSLPPEESPPAAPPSLAGRRRR
jgi:hypothetical protein